MTENPLYSAMACIQSNATTGITLGLVPQLAAGENPVRFSTGSAARVATAGILPTIVAESPTARPESGDRFETSHRPKENRRPSAAEDSPRTGGGAQVAQMTMSAAEIAVVGPDLRAGCQDTLHAASGMTVMPRATHSRVCSGGRPQSATCRISG